MASSKRKKHGAGYVILIAVLILVLLAVVAAVTGYSLVARRVKALQAGAAFTFDYEITSTADSPALYTILQKTGSTKGTVNGLYAPDALQLSISAPDAVIPAGPLTRVYISSSETLYDVGQLYKNIRSSITGSYPLASLLLPDWSLGSYISQAQLASLLGVDTTATSLQDMTEFELPQKKLQRVQPENAKDGYLYFQLDTGDGSANAPVLVIGLEKSRFFADAIPVHILLTIPEHGVSIQLTGTVSAQTVVLTAPTSRMKTSRRWCRSAIPSRACCSSCRPLPTAYRTRADLSANIKSQKRQQSFLAFVLSFYRSRMRPSVEKVTTFHGMNLPLFFTWPLMNSSWILA